MRKVIVLKLAKVERRVEEHYKATFAYGPEVVDTIARRCTEVDTGARNVDHILTRTLLPEMSAEFLARMAEGQGVHGVTITVGGDETFRYEVV
jgi:type VI secretion system protein VasG